MARLTPDVIVSRAIELMDRHGHEQFSVRKLGEAIDADPTAIYRHFRSKDELLRAMGDRVLTGVVEDLPTTSWTDCIRELCIRIRAANLAQPALAVLVRGAPPRHGNELRITETILARLIEAGFEPAVAAQAYHALIELTIGSAAIDAPLAAEPVGERRRTYAQWRSDYAALDGDAFPHAVELAALLYPGTADDRFAFALDRLLDGLALQLGGYPDASMGSPELRLRAATPADEAGVVACVNAAYAQYVPSMGRKPAPMSADYATLIRTGVVRVALVGDGSIVGVIVMWPEGDHLYVDNVAVLPGSQGLGIGTMLLDAVDAFARSNGLDEIRLYTNEAMTANLSYYPRRGYVETHRAEADGFKRVYFSRRLPSMEASEER
jgi:ribosomal protein S18 acetylase RimI-like enzyme